MNSLSLLQGIFPTQGLNPGQLQAEFCSERNSIFVKYSVEKYLLLEIRVLFLLWKYMGFPGGSDGKESTCNEGDLDSVPGILQARILE